MEKSVTEKQQIKTLSPRKKKASDSLSNAELLKLEGLINAIQAAGIDEFVEYIRSPWKMFWPNFFAGMVRGFGALVGVAFVLGILGWIFAVTIDLPLIGKRLEPYVVKAQTELNRYIDQTNYKDEFHALEMTLEQIEKNTQPGK